MVGKLPFLSDEFHFAIANVAVRSAQLEHHLEFAINALLLDKQKTSKFLLKNIQSSKLVDLYEALMSDEFRDESEYFEQLAIMIKDLRRDRNEILHWLWGKTEREDIAHHASIRPHREKNEKFKTVRSINSVADAMLKIVKIIVEWQELVGAKHKTTLPETPLPPVPPGGLLSSLAEGLQETSPPPERPPDSSQE